MVTRILLGTTIGAVLVTLLASGTLTSAEQQTDLLPLDSEMGVEVTTIPLEIAADNALPWAFVEGRIANHVSGYPVIIQIYDADGAVPYNDSGAVHFAQADIDQNGSYEYRFRVGGVQDGEWANLYEGDYIVKVFKVVYLDPTLGSV